MSAGTEASEHRNELAELVGPLWSVERTSQALGVEPAALLVMAEQGSLLTLTSSDGDVFYPVFQFTDTGTAIRVQDGLRPVLQDLRSFDPWAVAVLLHTPSPEFGDVTPLEAARSGADLREFGRTVAREWSAGDPR